MGCRQRCECEWRTTKLPGRGGGQQERPGKEEPLVGRRKEGSSQYQHCWSQFLVGFLHPVRWHPPDNGRQPRLVTIIQPEGRSCSTTSYLLCTQAALPSLPQLPPTMAEVTRRRLQLEGGVLAPVDSSPFWRGLFSTRRGSRTKEEGESGRECSTPEGLMFLTHFCPAFIFSQCVREKVKVGLSFL